MGFGSGASFPLFRSAVTQACNNFLGVVSVAGISYTTGSARHFSLVPNVISEISLYFRQIHLKCNMKRVLMMGQPLDQKLFSLPSKKSSIFKIYNL